MAFTLNVVGSDGVPVTEYRWLVQEDTTKDSKPGDPAIPGQHLSLSFHTSYAPVVAKGDHTTPPDALALDPAKRYYVSVLPNSAGTDGGYTNGGTQVAMPTPTNANPTTTVTVNKLPLKTAQISIYVFEDNNPINNAPDLPAEHGLAGFSIQLFEAGGSYGANGGRLMYDVFGNLLGTTYNPDGSVLAMGTGVITTDANGVVKIKNLAQGKYTIFVVPPGGQGWVQTATIEGTPGVDAWVKPNEPAFFQEFGPPGHHVFIGFTKPTNDATVLTGGSAITGRIVNQHMSRSPDYSFYNGDPVGRCWVGLNEMAAAPGKAIFAAPCNADSTFSIPNVPQGRYQLVVWDEPLHVVFASHIVDVPAGGGEVALMDVPVFNWFGRIKGQVFYDTNGNGFPDANETGIKDQAVNLRFRDGSIYQMQATDAQGTYEFEEVFPFFNWLVAEVDFARFKATGVTVTVDAGGPIDANDPWSFDGTLNPQAQSENAGQPYRTETGPVLLQGVQTFLGQANVMQWGKQNYNVAAGENGGISGIVRYATTRAENDPRFAAGENWEPGIPGVTVNLYQDFNADGVADGPAIATVTTDSWDASLPDNCQGNNTLAGVAPNACFDGLHNWNQVRPAVFDGGYAFMEDPANPGQPLPPGTYIVEAVAPPGYEHVKEEDKNVDFGDTYVPSPLALPPVCVGAPHVVPAELSLFPGVPGAFAGQTRPLCDRKQVKLAAGQNPPADFFMFTEVPVAGQIVGMILNDLANEFDPNAPNFGEKYAPPHMPISIRDWAGREISRVYSDAYGTYNALVPSTYTINAPMPSGVSPNMLTACLNSPMMPDPANPGKLLPDPWFNRQYTQFCYTFQYMPGKTTYLDTPVLPIAAMAGPGRFPLDCEYGDGTPMIHSVTNAAGQGPWVSAAGQSITITSAGQIEVPNPAWGMTGAPKNITRDYGFGDAVGTVGITNAQGVVVPLTGVSWSAGAISGTVPTGVGTGGQLVVTRGDNGQTTKHSVTVTVGRVNGKLPKVVSAGQSIQAAIDAPTTTAGDLITVAPGVYEELLVMHKPVKLQGWGPGSVTINAVKAPAEKLQSWRTEIATALNNGWFSLLPGQVAGPVDPQNNEPILFGSDEGAGITVLGNQNEFTPGSRPRVDGFTITGADHGGGIYVNGYANNLLIANNRVISNQGYYGGGIHVGNPALVSGDTYTDNQNNNLTIRNNQITQNGSLAGAGGGISLYKGTSAYKVTDNFVCGNFAMGGGGGIAHLGLSTGGRIARNTVLFNESFNQGQTVSGGGILVAGQPALAVGQPTEGAGNVTLTANLIQGNLAGAGDGGGIRAQLVNGLDVSAQPNNAGAWHRVDVFNNVIVDNIAGMAGGGISLQDTARVSIVHNTIANNDSTATAGGAFAAGSPNKSTAQPAGIVSYAHSSTLAGAFGTLSNTLPYRVFSNPRLYNNIVWHNRSFYWEIDPASTAVPPFGLKPAAVPFSDLAVIGAGAAACLKPNFSILTPETAVCGGNGNLFDDPLFVAEYVNNAPGQTIQQPELTVAIATAPAFDEGGNFIDVNFGPLTQYQVDTTTGLPVKVGGQLVPYGDYHISANSPARGAGSTDGLTPLQELGIDFDQQTRPQPDGSTPDAGADEIQ